MARKKKASKMLEKAEVRMAGLKAIDPQLDFGEGRSVEVMHRQMVQLRTRIEDYNRALAIIDSAKTEIKTMEKTLGDLVDKMLTGVAFQYGKESNEYEKAGGVRKSERARRSSVARLKNKAEQTAAKKAKAAK